MCAKPTRVLKNTTCSRSKCFKMFPERSLWQDAADRSLWQDAADSCATWGGLGGSRASIRGCEIKLALQLGSFLNLDPKGEGDTPWRTHFWIGLNDMATENELRWPDGTVATLF